MNRIIKTGLCAALGAAALLPLNAAAAAPGDRANVNVSIKVAQDNTAPNDDVLVGRVKSMRPPCKKPGRTVRLISNTVVIDTAELDADSRYEFRIENPHQAVFPYTVRIKGNDRCKVGVSKGVQPSGN